MRKTQLTYQQTGRFSKLMLDYVEGKAALKSFYQHSFDSVSFGEMIKERQKIDINRRVLVSALINQNKGFNVSDATEKNIEKLKSNNCFTVTTGHQLNLFTGPLYFIYKIISTINLANELKTNYPTTDFVPIYWMATEDHDYEEVNHFNLFENQYALEKTQNGAVGKMKLSGIDEVFTTLKEALGDRSNSESVLNLYAKYYTSEQTYAAATKGFVNELFGKYGLVIIDGDDQQLKKVFADDLKKELLYQTNHQTINASSEKIKALGYKVQLTPRKINIFYMKDDVRARIVFEDGRYKVLNTAIEFSELEILEELKNNPERFSPNAPMRCLYQEKILPNLAYIGGGGELAYWLQLKAMFDDNNISYPILGLRNTILLVDKGSSNKLQKLNITAAELFNDTNHLIKNYLKKSADTTLDLKEEEKIMEAMFDSISVKAGLIDSSLSPSIKAVLQKNLKALNRIEHRLLKAEKRKEEVAVNQIENIKERLFPNNSLQERHDNLISLFLFYGMDVVDDLMELLNPLDQKFTILTAE